MRQFLALMVACAAGGSASAQFGTSGQVVGSTYPLSAGGAMIPRAVSPAGMPIGSPFVNPMSGTPINPYEQPGFDKSMIAAPTTGFPGSPYHQPDLLDRLNDKLSDVTSFFRPGPSPRPTYTPGISRRNRERAEQRNWRRD